MADPRSGTWMQCPQGELGRLGGRLRARQRLQLLVSTAAAALSTAVVGGALYVATEALTTPSQGYCPHDCSAAGSSTGQCDPAGAEAASMPAEPSR